ncbi:uracil-DNA glycosylase [Celeribacter marinus]|uniref:uracil-DNA glycosylase n=1 Tax=Celeribacter marinus TaxID=1397108 RepID=UPI003F6CB06F
MKTHLDHIDFWDAHALLDWQVELGVSEPIGEHPVNRYDMPAAVPKPAPQASVVTTGKAPPPVRPQLETEVDGVGEAVVAAKSAASLDALREALATFEHCALKRGAHNLVFGDGNPQARVMVIGEAPTRDEDREGTPFVGRSGALLDKMFGAIGLDRASPDTQNGLYLVTALPWRPPENRDATPDEIAMLTPFLIKHIELADPDIIVMMGNLACQALTGRAGITRLRGTWQEVLGKPAMPMTHPAYLLRTPAAKREAWADLLEIQARLRTIS